MMCALFLCGKLWCELKIEDSCKSFVAANIKKVSMGFFFVNKVKL